jgi:glutamate carboxypeptidase
LSELTPREQEAIARIDASLMEARTRSWAAINSGTGNLSGVAQMGAVLADALSALPGDISFIDPEPVTRVGADGAVRAIEHGRHLRLAVRPNAPLQLLLTGHMDTVYGADHPFQAVRDLAPGVLNGPGVADMKGGLATMLAALAAVEAVGANTLGYEVLINSDEETGSMSSSALIAQAARGKRAALTYEPALADGTLAGARGGSVNLALAVRGRSAHAGRNPLDGRNSLVAAAALAVRLADATFDGLSVNPARIEGGGPNNVVPDMAVLHVNMRPRDAEAAARGEQAIAEAVATVSARYEVAVEVHPGSRRPPKPLDAAALTLFGLVRKAGEDLGISVAWRDTGGVCDGNNIAAAGVPVVDTMGVRGGSIHSSDEFVLLHSLHERAALSAVTMLRLAS